MVLRSRDWQCQELEFFQVRFCFFIFNVCLRPEMGQRPISGCWKQKEHKLWLRSSLGFQTEYRVFSSSPCIASSYHCDAANELATVANTVADERIIMEKNMNVISYGLVFLVSVCIALYATFMIMVALSVHFTVELEYSQTSRST